MGGFADDYWSLGISICSYVPLGEKCSQTVAYVFIAISTGVNLVIDSVW